jgi:dTDP-4-dehydrorhamnose 3,5-epimerase
MEVTELTVPGAFVLTPHQHGDDRGMFCEWFREDLLVEATGRALHLAQANSSVSRRGVLRGVHFADVPPGQAKYVSCPSGSVLDVVVDVRVGSATFGRWQSVLLDDRDRRAVFLSEGLGHAFLALTPTATVVYLCSTGYAPGREHGIHPLDPELGISWPDGITPILSAKDAAAPTLAQAELAGMLPTWTDCLALDEQLRANCAGSKDGAFTRSGDVR